MEKFLINNVETVTACSQSLIDEMSKYDVVRDDISVIHNPWNNIVFDKNASYEDIFNIRQAWYINILFSWSLEERKGITYFCEAMSEILEKNANVRITLSGKYWGSANANTKLSKEQVLSYFSEELRDRIIFLWLVPYESMPNVYQHVDICIFPSKYDNYPWVVIESLLMWKSVIASKNTWITETVDEWIIYINPENTQQIAYETQELIDNPEKLLSLWEAWYQKVISLNDAILADFIEYLSWVKNRQGLEWQN